jgi:hypothetical protein
MKHSAKSRGLEWSLSEEQVKSLITKPCYYCDSKPVSHNSVMSKRLNGNFPHNGIDRVDNSRGYSSDNVVSCCSDCNYMKRTLSRDKFKNKLLKFIII